MLINFNFSVKAGLNLNAVNNFFGLIQNQTSNWANEIRITLIRYTQASEYSDWNLEYIAANETSAYK
jgi:hypothetical protein